MPLHPRDVVRAQQRRRRWLLYLAAALLVFAANRCAVGCKRPKTQAMPGGRWALGRASVIGYNATRATGGVKHSQS